MPSKARLRDRLSYANVVSTLCLFLVLGGAAVAASRLPKGSVGTMQIRRHAVKAGKLAANAVTKRAIRRRAVASGKLADGAVTTEKLGGDAVTGAKLNEATLGAVPLAEVAEEARTIAAPEDWHEVGAPGEPAFQNGWDNLSAKTPPALETVAFYKDREGSVHLKGAASGGAVGTTIFQLPPGYRPAAGRVLYFIVPCTACADIDSGTVRVYGSALPVAGLEGAVLAPAGTLIGFDGVAFRAAS
ncbi:MAG TPA: hypothetical protein VH703_01850 [Solirubrobacterales bacterium]|jgi:hypothetical protein